MKLSALVEDIQVKILQGSLETEVTDIACDSRESKEGSLFICISGANVDGHDFTAQVIEKGAAALVTERAV